MCANVALVTPNCRRCRLKCEKPFSPLAVWPPLPATKAQPKEILPVVDKPIIQYGVEEAIHSGIQNIIIVTGRGKSAIEDHVDVRFELENLLETRRKKELLATVRAISDNVSYVRRADNQT